MPKSAPVPRPKISMMINQIINVTILERLFFLGLPAVDLIPPLATGGEGISPNSLFSNVSEGAFSDGSKGASGGGISIFWVTGSSIDAEGIST